MERGKITEDLKLDDYHADYNFVRQKRPRKESLKNKDKKINGRPKNKATRPEYMRLFEKAIESANDHDQHEIARRIEKAYIARKNRTDSLIERKNVLQDGREPGKLRRQYKDMMKRMIEEIDYYLATNASIANKTERLNQKNRLSTIRDLIAVMKVLREFESETSAEYDQEQKSIEFNNQAILMIENARDKIKEAGVQIN